MIFSLHTRTYMCVTFTVSNYRLQSETATFARPRRHAFICAPVDPAPHQSNERSGGEALCSPPRVSPPSPAHFFSRPACLSELLTVTHCLHTTNHRGSPLRTGYCLPSTFASSASNETQRSFSSIPEKLCSCEHGCKSQYSKYTLF